MKSIFIISILFPLACNSQVEPRENLNNFITALLSKNRIEIKKCDEFKVDTIKEDVFYRLTRDKYNITLGFNKDDNTRDTFFIRIDNYIFKGLMGGNSEEIVEPNYLMAFDSPSFFSLDSTDYFCIPAGIRNCSGMACKTTYYYLLKLNKGNAEIYFFENYDIPFLFPIRVKNKTELCYLNILSSTFHDELFTEKEKNDNLNTYYKIKLLKFNDSSKKWKEIKDLHQEDYYIHLKVSVADFSNEKVQIISSKWPF